MNTISLAEILGIILIVMGLSMLSNKKGMTAIMDELTQSKVFMWLGGLVALIVGAVFVVLNGNAWTSGLSLLVAVIGWLALLKGIFLILFPKTAGSFYKKVNKSGVYTWGGLIVLILGLILIF